MISAWVGQNVLSIMVAFARVGTAMILMPGFGDGRFPARAKIALCFLVSLCMLPVLQMPNISDSPTFLVGLFLREALIGVFIGMGARLFLAGLSILGGIIGFASGLSNAMAPQDSHTEGANSIAAMLSLAVVTLIFITNSHHIILHGLLMSYRLMPIGNLMLGDMVEQIARLGAMAFYSAVLLGAPFILFSVLFNLSLGLANRVMPSMQVFFVAGPGMILAGLLILAIAAPAILDHIIGALSGWFTTLIVEG